VTPPGFDSGRQGVQNGRIRGQRLGPPGQRLKPEPAEDERRNPFRVGGSEHGRHECCVGPSRNARADRPGRVHDGDDVVDVLLQRGNPGHRVGHARAALVENYHATEACEAVKEGGQLRQFPYHFEVRRPAGDQDQVVPGTEDLVSKVNLTGAHKPRLRDLAHDPGT